MKSFMHLLACLLIFNTMSAQEVIARLDLGKRDAKPDFYEYCPTDKGMVTMGPVTVAANRIIGIVKYDEKMNRQWMKEVLEQNGRKHVDFLTVIGDNIFVFVSEFFPKDKVIKTLYYKYNLRGDVLASDEVLSVYPNQQEQKVDLEYELSPNKKKLLCYKNLRNRRESEQILYYLFDDAGDLVQNGELKFRYPDDKFSVTDLRISNEGNIFILGKLYKTDRIIAAKDYQYLAYHFDRKTEKMKEIPVNFGNKYITNLAFRIDKEENMYVAGFYSELGTDKIVGTVFQKIGTDNKIILEATEEFSDEFKANFLSKGQIERGKELSNFYMHNEGKDNGIVLRSDGGVLLMAERYYTTTQSYRDYYTGYWSQQTLYHYEDVILTSVSPEGKIEWHAIADKTQAGLDPANLSYFYAIGGEGAYIFYEYSGKKAGTSVYYNLIEMDGKTATRVPLLKDYKWDSFFYPRYCEQVNNSEALMVYFSRGGSELSVIKVKIK